MKDKKTEDVDIEKVLTDKLNDLIKYTKSSKSNDKEKGRSAFGYYSDKELDKLKKKLNSDLWHALNLSHMQHNNLACFLRDFPTEPLEGKIRSMKLLKLYISEILEILEHEKDVHDGKDVGEWHSSINPMDPLNDGLNKEMLQMMEDPNVFVQNHLDEAEKK